MSSQFLRVVRPGAPAAEVASRLADALAGGSPIAPLPGDAAAAERVRSMLRPDLPVAEPDAAAVLSTSGSTGAPKGVVLSRAAITASATATEQRLGGPGHWLLALPTHYVAGLMLVARAVVAGRDVLEVGSDLSGLPAALGRIGGDRCHLSVVPTQLTRALRDPDLTAALSRVDSVLLGGGPAAPDLLERARDAGVPVVTTYGMSETCGGCVYDGLPLPGVTVALDRAADTSAASPGDHPGSHQEGRILLGGPVVFSGYRLRPDLTTSTLLAGMVRSNDRGALVDGRLQILGRYDDVIISGGMKIDTAAVERAARDWPDLGGAEIAVVGVPDAEWGTRPIAYAESTSGDLDPGRLRAFLDTRLARHELPAEVIVVPALPRTSSGKVDREKLRRGVAHATSRRETPVDPSTGPGRQPHSGGAS